MRCVGIICEYNPFHNGHQYQLREASRGAGGIPVIAVMSGNFVQRAAPAVTDKWTRTRMALEGGASLVLELPTCYSTAGSETFAGAAVYLMEQTGLISHLSFGAETPDLSVLKDAAHIVLREPEPYALLLKKGLREGKGYAAARQEALNALLKTDPDLLRAPNNILAIEYCKALERLSSAILPLPVKRGADSRDLCLHDGFASASAVRAALYSGLPVDGAVPPAARRLLTPDRIAAPFDDWSKELHYRLCFHDAKSLPAICEIGEGLENRILACADPSKTISALVEEIHGKRYPRVRIRRILLNILLDMTRIQRARMEFHKGPGYIRVLGFRKEAEGLLSALISSARLPVVTNLPRQLRSLPEPAKRMLEAEIRYTDLYFAHVPGRAFTRGAEFTRPLVIV